MELRGLKGAPQHNGKRGTALEHVLATGRWKVKLVGGDEKVISVKPENLHMVEAELLSAALLGPLLNSMPQKNLLRALYTMHALERGWRVSGHQDVNPSVSEFDWTL